MCNKCGNCAGFCPQNGNPYKDKFTVFWTMDDFLASDNQGFFITKQGEFIIRHDNVAYKHKKYVLEDPAVPQKVWNVIKKYLSDYHYTWIS
jgi:putative selenate reductase